MKHWILAAALSFVSLKGVVAQSQNAPVIDARKMRMGLCIGPVSGWMKPTAAKSNDGLYKVKDQGNVLGFSWGLIGDYYFTDNYAIATGFLLTNSGGHILATRITESGVTNIKNQVSLADFTYYLQYAEIPLNIKFRTDELPFQSIRLFGQMGISAGLNISKKATYRVVYYNSTGVEKEVGEEKEKLVGGLTIAPIMFQLNIGGGIEKPLTSKISAYLGVFFNNGFFPDATNPGSYTLAYSSAADFSDGKIRLNNIAVRLGLLF